MSRAQLSHPSATLIPEARGRRAQVAVALLLALCGAAFWLAGQPLVPTIRRLTLHIAALQIGALLRGVCCLAEEIFHLQSRYQGSFWKALGACFPWRWHGPTLLTCAMAYVALLDGEKQLLSLHLGLASLCQLLSLALGLHKPSAVEMSELVEKSKQNVANGLAWSYYIGYLKIVLPRIKETMDEFRRANPTMLLRSETWKLHILVPLSCDIFDDLEKADSNIQYLTDLSETILTKAGIKNRVYKHSLYAIKDEDNKPWHCVMEFATPLQSLYAMSQDDCSAFSREERLEQAKLFYRTLEEILRGSKECRGTYRLIAYQEPGEAEPHFLSRELLWHLRQQCQEEYSLCDTRAPTPQLSPAPSLAPSLASTELNLQISHEDLPLPLRSDCF